MSLTLVKLLSLLGGVPLWLSSWVCGLIHWRLGSRGCSWWLHHLAPLARGWSQCCAVPEPGRPSWGGSADQLPGSQGLKVLLLGLATEWMLGPWGLLCRDPLGEGEPSLYGGGEGGHSPSLCSCLGRLVGCSVGGIPERSRVSHAPIEGMWGQESSVQRVCRSLLRPVEKHMVNLWLCWFLPFGAKKKKKKSPFCVSDGGSKWATPVGPWVRLGCWRCPSSLSQQGHRGQPLECDHGPGSRLLSSPSLFLCFLTPVLVAAALLNERMVKIVSRLTLKVLSFPRPSIVCKHLKKHALPSSGLLHCPASSSTVLEFIIRDTFGLWASRSLTGMQVPGCALLWPHRRGAKEVTGSPRSSGIFWLSLFNSEDA